MVRGARIVGHSASMGTVPSACPGDVPGATRVEWTVGGSSREFLC